MNTKFTLCLRLTACSVWLAASVFLVSCNKDDDKPKTIPEVTTFDATDVTTTTATVTAEITSDGNTRITESGFVYSSIVDEPTTADEIIVVESDDDDMLEVLLENLSSGTTYHVRAYATNSEGVGYGNVIDVNTGNAAPTATDVAVTGTLGIGSKLTGVYTYSDAEGDPQGTSTYQWYVADNAAGLNEAAIDGETELEYIVLESQFGKYFRFAVTPKATTGVMDGTEIKSLYTANGVGDQVEVNFIYNNQPVTYGIINSSVTGRKWLDRSLGAANSPTALDDWVNWGHLFQWGRGADGHQIVTRTGSDINTITGTGVIGTNASPTYSSTDDPGHAFFIVMSSGSSKNPWDWRKPQNDNLWQGVDGTNNPCPSGWHVPTQQEWQAEGLTTPEQAYTQLKLTYNFSRGFFGQSSYDGGVYNSEGIGHGFYWTSTIVPLPFSSTGGKGANVFVMGKTSSTVTMKMATEWDANYLMRAYAYECRCIKDE